MRRRSSSLDHHLALGAEHDPFERVREVRLLHDLVVAPRGGERRLVDEVREIGADHAGRRGRDPGEVDVGAERDAARVHAEDRLAARAVGRLDGDAAVEPSGAEQAPGRARRVGSSLPITITLVDGVESVHLGEDLVQRLLALVVAAAEAADAARPRRGRSRPARR